MKTWTCACGRFHQITGKEIICVGIGHTVIIKPEYFSYRSKPEAIVQPVNKDQYALF